jgi:hypothetical protein
MITISFNTSDQRVVAALAAKGQRIVRSMAEGMDEAMLALQRRVQQKLSGEVLEHRSGKLLGSVEKRPVIVDETKIEGRVSAAGGPAFYGRIQEAGGTREYDIYPVNKKALAFFPAGSVGGAIARGTGPMLPGKSTVRGLYFRSGSRRGELKESQYGTFRAMGGIVVKHVVHPPLPKRAFMVPSLREMQQEIVDKLLKAAVRGFKS